DRSEILGEVLISGPEVLIAYGHHAAARSYFEVLKSGGEDFLLDKKTLGIVRRQFRNLKGVDPLYQELVDYLDENPWPDLQKVEEGDLVESALDCIDVYSDESAVEFRYVLRGMVEFGPQYDMIDRLSELYTISDIWRSDVDNSSDSETETPEGIEPLIDLVVSLWERCPETEFTSQDDAIYARGELIQLREGDDAAVVFYDTVVDDEERDSYTRISALREIGAIKESNQDFEGYLSVLKRIESFENLRSWSDRAIVDAAYLCLVHGKRSEAWKRFKKVANAEGKKSEMRFPAGTKKIAEGFLAEQKTSDQWWDLSSEWWPIWKELAGAIGGESNHDEIWRFYCPWEHPSERNLKKVVEGKKKQKQALKVLLEEQMEYARWHPQGAENAVRLLERASVVFGDHASDIDALADRLKAVPGSTETAVE
ncbi:MAG: hypothetical protein HRU46_18690, partial [Verrucomicrobiales bacterium]|nr:hypothetical protein [Verrucomicrobiales bacterium]